jgi:hypothetical protein
MTYCGDKYGRGISKAREKKKPPHFCGGRFKDTILEVALS